MNELEFAQRAADTAKYHREQAELECNRLRTERDEAKAALETALFDKGIAEQEAFHLRAALAELVRLKRIKDEMDSGVYLFAEGEEYAKRKPIAWDVARSLVGKATP